MEVLIIILFLIAFASACMLIGYKLGAKEQKKIWINKAFKCFNTCAIFYINEDGDGVIDFDAFRKAMEE